MVATESRIGNLIFEQDEDGDGNVTVTVHKSADLEGWITFGECPESDVDWTNVRNNCYPLNGKAGPPPAGQWVLFEFVGKEGSSNNLAPDTSALGFTNEEIKALLVIVNIAYGENTRLRKSQLSEKRVTH